MWHYYYNFDSEFQLDCWETLTADSQGGVRIACTVESPAEMDKILLRPKEQKPTGNVVQILEINGMPVRNRSGFYIGRRVERQGYRIHLHKGMNRIEALVIPGEGGIEKLRMQLIDVPAKIEVKDYFRIWKAPDVAVYPERSEIPIDGMTPGAGHQHYPGRFGFVKGAGLLDCSMHAFGKISKMYLCGDPRTQTPWVWGYSLIQDESSDTEDAAKREDYQVSPLVMRWRRETTEYLCSTAFPGIATVCPQRPYLKVSELVFTGNYQYVLTAGEVASTGRFSGNLPENWLLLFGSTEYPDVPLLLIPDRQPEKVEFLRNEENRLSEVRLYGCERLTSLTPFGFEPLEPQRPDDETFLAGAAKRCRFWARASLSIPTACREYFSNDRVKKTVRIVQKFEYQEFSDGWNTEKLHLAPLPPVAGLNKEGFVSEGAWDYRFPTKYGPMTGVAGRSCEYTVKMMPTYRQFPLKQDNSEAEKLLLSDLENYFEFQSRFPEKYRSYAYPGALLEGYAFSGTMFLFMPREKRDFLAETLSRRMKEACDPDGKYTLLRMSWGYLFRTSPDRDGTERYYKGETVRNMAMEMHNLYDRSELFTGASYKLCYLNCSMLFDGQFKTGTQDEIGNYPDPYAEVDWGTGCFFYMLYLSALISGDYSAIRERWDVIKKIFAYFEIFHDWACMGAGYAEKGWTWAEGASFGAFPAYINMARAVGDHEAEEKAVYLAAKRLVLDKARFFSGPYFAGLYHVEPWYGNSFFQEEYDLYCNFQSVPDPVKISPLGRIRLGTMHNQSTEGIYPELYQACRETAPEYYRMMTSRFREAYGGGFDTENPSQGRLVCDFSYLLVNDSLDPDIPPEQTLRLIRQAKSTGKLMRQWHDVHRYENNTPADYLESQMLAWLEMRTHPLYLLHWEDVRILSAEWHEFSSCAEIEVKLTGGKPSILCGIRKQPETAELNGKQVEWELLEDHVGQICPTASGVLRFQFRKG